MKRWKVSVQQLINECLRQRFIYMSILYTKGCGAKVLTTSYFIMDCFKIACCFITQKLCFNVRPKVVFSFGKSTL